MIHIQEEAARCLLCEDAPCTKACKTGDPARAIRAIRFDNAKNAWRWIAACSDADLERAEQACIHYDTPIRITSLLSLITEEGWGGANSLPTGEDRGGASSLPTDESWGGASPLAITFCGIRCENPFFLASSAVCTNYEMVARALEMGWAGVFYKTICKQEIREVSPRFDAVKRGSQFAGFRNMEQLSENPYEVDFDILHRLKMNYPSKVIIASIMGQYEEEWIELAKLAEEAGCDAVELNFSCPQMRLAGLGSDIGQASELVNFYTSFVKRSVNIPVIPKMTPNITHITRPATGAYFGGADAISAINTIKSVTMSKEAEVSGKQTLSGYSGHAVKPIALRFILEMSMDNVINGSHGKRVELSGIGGIETWHDALEFIQLGCSNVQVCTAVMEYGYRIIDDLVLGITTYMAERGVEHVGDLVGEQLPNFVLPSNLDRKTIVYPKFDREQCIGCGRCYRSCQDGGHQAIAFDTDTRRPRLIGTKCVGCHLCRLVCPAHAIGMAKRINKKK